MRTLASLQKQQVGLRLPTYLIEELDSLSKSYDLNRSEIITEAISSYIEEQKAVMFYKEFEDAASELKAAISGNKKCDTLNGLINELSNN